MRILETLLYELIKSEYNIFIYKEPYIRKGEYKSFIGYGIYRPIWPDQNLVKNDQYHTLNKNLVGCISDSWFRFFLYKYNIKTTIIEFKKLIYRNI